MSQGCLKAVFRMLLGSLKDASIYFDNANPFQTGGRKGGTLGSLGILLRMQISVWQGSVQYQL